MFPDTSPDEPRSPFSPDALRQIAREKVLWKFGVQIHLLAFTFINLLLVAINLVIVPAAPWFPYPLSSWATGLAIHVAVYLIYSRGVIGTNRRGLLLSTVIVAMSFQSLFVINFFSGFSYQWFWWPAGALVAALVVYLLVFLFIIGPDVTTGDKRTWLDKKIDNELAKVKQES